MRDRYQYGHCYNVDGVPHYFDGKKLVNLKAVLGRTRLDAAAYEKRQDTSLKEWRRRVATRSIDMPHSREARLAPVDCKSAATIRKAEGALMMPIFNDRPKEDYNFYSGRMAQAIAYIAGRRGYDRDSDEWRQLSAFLWTVYSNWRSGKREETIKALKISEETYRKRIQRLQAEFDDPAWAAYLAVGENRWRWRVKVDSGILPFLCPPPPSFST